MALNLVNTLLLRTNEDNGKPLSGEVCSRKFLNQAAKWLVKDLSCQIP